MPAEVDFWSRYSSLCSKAKVCPLRSIFRRLKGTELCCPVEVIRSEHWPFLLSALSADTNLTKLQFISERPPVVNEKEYGVQRKRKSGLQFPVPYGCSERNVSDICRCVAHLLRSSRELKILKIERLCLKKEDASTLEKSFKDSSVEVFSLSGCKLQDEAFEIICRGLQLSNVQWIDFSSCDLKASEMSYVFKIIKAHNHRRSNELFPHTLRYQIPVFDDMKGLSRITLNNNKIGDRDVEIVVSICDDVWIKALDLQKCCIGNDGAKAILNVTKRNAGLQLIDLRLNNIDENIMDRITLQIALNNVGKVLEYDLGSVWKPTKNTTRISCRKAFLKTKVLKYSPPKGRVLNKEPARVSVKKNAMTSSEEASSQTSLDYGIELMKAKKVLSKYNILLKRYKKENYLLQKEIEKLSSKDDYILIDHKTFSEVTSTFEKLKKFLVIMKEYGFLDCISMLEENESFKKILRPLIHEAIKECIKIVHGDSSSERVSQSYDSVSINSLEKAMVQLQKQVDNSNSHNQEHQLATKYNSNLAEPKVFCSRVMPEVNYVKKPVLSDKALVQKVFKEVMESYTNSSHSSDRMKPMIQPSVPQVHAKQISSSQFAGTKRSIPETTTELQQQLNVPKGSHNRDHGQSATNPKTVVSLVNPSTDHGDSGTHPKSVVPSMLQSTDHGQKGTYPKSVVSSMHATNVNSRESIIKLDSVKTSGSAIEPITEISISSSKSVSDGSSTLHKTIEPESDQSSIYKSLPKMKPEILSLLDKDDLGIGLSSKKKGIATTSKCNTKPLPSNSQTSSESDNPKSSRTSKSKASTQKSSVHSSPYSSKHTSSLSKHPVPEMPLGETVPKSSSSASSVRSNSSKSSNKESVHSSVELANSGKSYLESVSEASTDKDVKSLSESEVYSSDKSKKDSNKSQQQPKDVPQKEKSVSPTETHPELAKRAVHSTSTKSSETKLTQKKASGKELEKDNKSVSSVPSLSEITTVSSHSLNTDSVMGQLSDY